MVTFYVDVSNLTEIMKTTIQKIDKIKAIPPSDVANKTEAEDEKTPKSEEK